MLCAVEDLNIPHEIQSELYNLELVRNTKQEIENVSSILEFMDNLPTKSLVWATRKCLEMKPTSMEFEQDYEHFRKKCLTPYGLLGSYLHPDCERSSMFLHMKCITELIVDKHSKEVLRSFSLFKRHEDIFRKLKSKKMDYVNFWINVKDFEEHTELAVLALKIWSFPSSSILRKIPKFDYETENIEKLLTIFLWHAE